MNESDPVPRPDGFPEDDWQELRPGERVRWLRASSDQTFLGAEVYRALSRLPFWVFYGPEHGLPPDFFNDRGFILPRYRPGGSDFEDFRRWRRVHRVASFLHGRASRRCRTVADRLLPVTAVVGVVAYVITFRLVHGLLVRGFGEFWGEGLVFPALLVTAITVLALFVVLRAIVVPRMAAGAARRAIADAERRRLHRETLAQGSSRAGVEEPNTSSDNDSDDA
jgi:hypothetical protein